MNQINLTAQAIVQASFRISQQLGHGMLESVYVRVLGRDLIRTGHRVEIQKSISFEFEGLHFKNGFKVDLFVDGLVVVEVKSASALTQADHKQLLTYLKLMNCKLGLLINFGSPLLKNGLKRIANGL
jgi:iron complex transport system substrate-binding protein